MQLQAFIFCCAALFMAGVHNPASADADQQLLEQAMVRLPDSQNVLAGTANPVQAAELGKLQRALLAHYAEWEGTRYRLGGTGRKGIDCSSFIQTLFKDHFSFELPRSSREQMTMGKAVDQSELQTGDLLFFKTGPTRKHVGVYLGNNQFMHVSARRGVEITKLLTPYWQKHFIEARRISLGLFKPSN